TTADDYVKVYLVHRTCDSGNWNFDVSAEFSFVQDEISLDCGEENFFLLINKLNSTFRYGQTTRLGCDDYIRIPPESLTVQVRFTISNIAGISPSIDFTDPSDPRHNVAFVIHGKEKLYANKQVMFFGGFAEKDKKEIELKGIDR
ncbi:hypothetical protein PMAYCL1PPCAC_14597, partial [Pristionchus mayeri]